MAVKIGVATGETNTDITKAGGGGHDLGDRHGPDHDGNTWVFVKATVAITQYDTVVIENGFTAKPITDAVSKQPVELGFAQVAFTVDHYGWVMTSGRPTVRVAIDCEPNVPLYVTGTAGVLDDATTSQKIEGLVITTSMTAAGSVAAVAHFPRISWGANLSQI